MDLHPHLVIPGQLISSADRDGEDSFLRGHGTYMEETPDGSQIQLRASVTGIVQRVNKLISVDSVALQPYAAQVGDLVVGRIVAIGNARWSVELGSISAVLPLSGVHLPGSVQRIKTVEDAREMRTNLAEGDLVSAEVHKVLPQTVMLHTRSVRYGKLENGCLVIVPSRLVPRQKAHFLTICKDQFQILLALNGYVWIQRNTPLETPTQTHEISTSSALEQQRKEHAEMSYTTSERQELARLRNVVVCLRQTLSEVTPEAIEEVYEASQHTNVSDMLLPANVVRLTECRRNRMETNK